MRARERVEGQPQFVALRRLLRPGRPRHATVRARSVERVRDPEWVVQDAESDHATHLPRAGGARASFSVRMGAAE